MQNKLHHTLWITLLLAAVSAFGETNKTYEVEAFYFPLIDIWEDDDRAPDGARLDANVHTGDGWGLRIAKFGDNDDGTPGLAYLYTRHNVNSADDKLESHSVYIDAAGNIHLAESGPVKLETNGNIGVGGVLFDFSDPKRGSRGGGALMGRLALRATLLDSLFVSAGGGAYLFGYPGETLGYGVFVLLSTGIDF